MRSKTKKADEVREFYYDLENLVDNYKDYIVDGLQKKINLLQNNQKPKINPTRGVIYIIYTGDNKTLYKIDFDVLKKIICDCANLNFKYEKYINDAIKSTKNVYIMFDV